MRTIEGSTNMYVDEVQVLLPEDRFDAAWGSPYGLEEKEYFNMLVTECRDGLMALFACYGVLSGYGDATIIDDRFFTVLTSKMYNPDLQTRAMYSAASGLRNDGLLSCSPLEYYDPEDRKHTATLDRVYTPAEGAWADFLGTELHPLADRRPPVVKECENEIGQVDGGENRQHHTRRLPVVRQIPQEYIGRGSLPAVNPYEPGTGLPEKDNIDQFTTAIEGLYYALGYLTSDPNSGFVLDKKTVFGVAGDHRRSITGAAMLRQSQIGFKNIIIDVPPPTPLDPVAKVPALIKF